MGPAHARWAPTEMNEMSDAQLRGLLLHAWQPAPGGHAASRLPLLATFITNATLLRVRNLLVPIAPANGLTTALGYALAALTGAPQPACECTAHHIGNAASSCITNYDLRRKALGKPSIVSKTKWMRERQKRDDEALFVDASWGGTPPAPSEAILLAGFTLDTATWPAPPPVNVSPVPTQPMPMGRTTFVEHGQMVMDIATVEELRAAAARNERERDQLISQAPSSSDATRHWWTIPCSGSNRTTRRRSMTRSWGSGLRSTGGTIPPRRGSLC